jgi:hypothetical protein
MHAALLGKWIARGVGLLLVIASGGRAESDVKPFFVFYPPLPPIAGQEVPATVSVVAYNGREATAPEELAGYVGENFYPALGARLFDAQGKLNSGLEKKLTEYRDRRAAALTDLQNKLTEVERLAPADAERELRAFAAKQDRTLSALEDTAEALRGSLVDGGLFGFAVNPIDARRWHLGSATLPPPLTAVAEFYALRDAIYFQDGLSAEQRDLLCEIVLEQRENSGRGRRSPGRSSSAQSFYFSPGGARLELPDNLSPDLALRIRSYEQAQFEEKKTLIDALTKWDEASPPKRTRELRALADFQAPRLAHLEELADGIRRALALVPPPAPPPLPPKLPPNLSRQLEHWRTEAQALATERIRYMRDALSGLARAPGQPRPAITAEQTTREFLEQNADRSAALQAEREKLLHDGEEFAALNTDPATGQPMDVGSLFAYIKKADAYFAQVGRSEALYANYNRAVLTVGLSALQRRLLFHSAVAGLAQPLPAGLPVREAMRPPLAIF